LNDTNESKKALVACLSEMYGPGVPTQVKAITEELYGHAFCCTSVRDAVMKSDFWCP
jgi:hypothetical protein